jgi:hypothetical protein
LEPTRKRLGKPLERIRVPIKMTKELQEVADAGLDFPRYRLPATVALKAPQIDVAQAQNADRHQDRSPGLTQPSPFNLLAGEQQ